MVLPSPVTSSLQSGSSLSPPFPFPEREPYAAHTLPIGHCLPELGRNWQLLLPLYQDVEDRTRGFWDCNPELPSGPQGRAGRWGGHAPLQSCSYSMYGCLQSSGGWKLGPQPPVVQASGPGMC